MSQSPFSEVISRASEVVLGKNRELRLALACFLARGHLLIEDVPGVGKTLLVQALGKVLGLEFKRIQFTSDLLPADLIGTSIFDPKDQEFRFHPGPLFSQLVLADELNRATPKTQSAFLQAMEEAKISVDGQTHLLPQPFFFVATQNPRQQVGTFSLPESQVDRFMMSFSMGYPSPEYEKSLLKGFEPRLALEKMTPALDEKQIMQMREAVAGIKVSDHVALYLSNLLEFSRDGQNGVNPLSSRAGVAWVRSAQAWAYLQERDYVLPEDVQEVASSVLAHRLDYERGLEQGKQRVARLMESVKVPV